MRVKFSPYTDCTQHMYRVVESEEKHEDHKTLTVATKRLVVEIFHVLELRRQTGKNYNGKKNIQYPVKHFYVSFIY